MSIPSFFMISNLGGGGSDKYREAAYQNIYGNVPTLFNYYYLKNKKFAKQELDQLDNYSDFHLFLDMVQKSFIAKKFTYKNNAIETKSDQVILLDSGASNIINDLIKIDNMDDVENLELWQKVLWEEAKKYYEFANRYKFDMVIGFDIGGKYTFKAGEKKSEKLINANKFISSNAHKINYYIAEQTIKYLKQRENFYPSLYVTVHGSYKSSFEEELIKIKRLESENNYHFFGIAIGGVASAKNADPEWFPPNLDKKQKNTYLVANTVEMVAKKFPKRPIHVLGGGSFKNIVSASIAGATSYDTQTPGRRAYDGSGKSANNVDSPKKGDTFSKYLPAFLDEKGNIILNDIRDYVRIDKVANVKLCNCPACDKITKFDNLKQMYKMYRSKYKEPYYFARQLMNIHAIYQHIYLSNYVSKHTSFDSNVKDQFIEESYGLTKEWLK